MREQGPNGLRNCATQRHVLIGIEMDAIDTTCGRDAGSCEYGGIESIARCAGGDGGKPCADVLYDRARAPQIREGLDLIVKEMTQLPESSPRYRALKKERLGMENFLNVIQWK